MDEEKNRDQNQAPQEQNGDSGQTTAEDNVIAVLKIGFSFLSVDVHGLAEIFFNTVHYQTERINAVVNFDREIFTTSPSLHWKLFEEKIIDLICTRDFNYRLSNELKKKLDEYINYRKFEEFQILLKSGNIEELRLFMGDMLSGLYNVPEYKLLLELEFISLNDFQNRAAEEQVVLVDEDGMSELDVLDQDTILEGELVLAPVFGIPIMEVAVGDVLFVRVQEPERENRLSPMRHERPIQQEAIVRSVIHDDLIGHTVFAELRPGVLIKAIETEDVKVKCIPQEHRPFLRRFASTVLNWYVLLFILLFIIILFVIMQVR